VAPAAPGFELAQRGSGAVLVLRGDWLVAAPPPSLDAVLGAIRACAPQRLVLDCSALGQWDSVLLSTLRACRALCLETGVAFDTGNTPAPAQRLLALSDAVAPHRRPAEPRAAVLRRLLAGEPLRRLFAEIVSACTFLGDLLIACARLCAGRARMRTVDLLWFVQQAGPQALGIVTLISVLVGMILAYLGSVQLQQLGAQVYVADLVALGMVREMAPLMTAVIMAGRTGAAYAAQLGTMQTREEIDAIETLGISPMEFLVLPRMLALVLVMPMLCIYSDVLGMLGGAPVAMAMDVTWGQYLAGAQEVVTITHIATGVAKSIAFAVLIGAAGCRAGLRCGRSSEAVGQATTTAVVRAIVWLVVADAAFNIVYQRLGI
jgi:phospholipid/cholesterol/gamma-HCH transport system permease protein